MRRNEGSGESKKRRNGQKETGKGEGRTVWKPLESPPYFCNQSLSENSGVNETREKKTGERERDGGGGGGEGGSELCLLVSTEVGLK